MQTIKKSNLLVWVAAIVMLITGTAITVSKKNQQAAKDLLPVDLHAFKMSDGWGYEVLVDKKIFIHQDCIPTIASFKKFNSEADALLIGNIVVSKIKKGQHPAVSLQEIKDAQINYTP